VGCRAGVLPILRAYGTWVAALDLLPILRGYGMWIAALVLPIFRTYGTWVAGLDLRSIRLPDAALVSSKKRPFGGEKSL